MLLHPDVVVQNSSQSGCVFSPDVRIQPFTCPVSCGSRLFSAGQYITVEGLLTVWNDGAGERISMPGFLLRWDTASDFSTDLQTGAGRTASADPPGSRSTCAGQVPGGGSVRPADHRSPLADTQQASPSAGLLVAALPSPYFPRLLRLVTNSIDTSANARLCVDLRIGNNLLSNRRLC